MLAHRFVGRRRKVGQRNTGEEEDGSRCPSGLGQKIAGPAAAEHLLCPAATERTQATALARLDQDHQDQERAGHDVQDGKRGVQKISHAGAPGSGECNRRIVARLELVAKFRGVPTRTLARCPGRTKRCHRTLRTGACELQRGSQTTDQGDRAAGVRDGPSDWAFVQFLSGAALAIFAKPSASSAAPPTRAPSMSGQAKRPAALSALTLPPYRMRVTSASSALVFLS